MNNLPQFQTDDRDFQLMQSAWATAINPLLRNAALNGSLIQNVVLVTGSNQVNHKLGRKLQGWFIVRQRAAASVYDQQDSNTSPALTLSLVSSANVNVDIYVF